MFVTIMIQWFLIYSLRGQALQTSCREPDTAEMDRMQKGILKNYMYMSEVTGSRSHLITGIDHDCPAYRPPQKGENLPLCPTFQELDLDATRIPSDIVQTRCRCTNCVLRHKHRHQHMCKPVLRHIPVLKKVSCVEGVFEYREFLQEVSVTCVCTKKHSSQLNNQDSSVMEKRSRSNDTIKYPITERMSIDFKQGSRFHSPVHADDVQRKNITNQQNVDHNETEKMPE